MNTMLVKTKRCTVCGQYEIWTLEASAVLRWQKGENIQRAFPTMKAEDREVLISGTHPACWNQLFGEGENE